MLLSMATCSSIACIGAAALMVSAVEPPPVQQYQVRYAHTVRNKTKAPLTDVIVYLPVPQSDEYQQIADFRVDVGNNNYDISNRTDAYGTRIKRIQIPTLAPAEEATVGFTCVATLHAPVKVELSPAKGASLEALPQDIRDKYTIDHDALGLQTPIVKALAERFLREHPNPVERAKAIHDHLASTLKYENKDGWDSAPRVLERGSGSCSEFSHAFAAVCRATGIPTRFVGGSIFPLKSIAPFEDRGWHRWCEAYLPNHGWVPFDVTLDRAKPAKPDFIGTHHPRVLILTRIGTRSKQLGASYIGSNSHGGQTTRTRTFTWTNLRAESTGRGKPN